LFIFAVLAIGVIKGVLVAQFVAHEARQVAYLIGLENVRRSEPLCWLRRLFFFVYGEAELDRGEGLGCFFAFLIALWRISFQH
jgi:hypothetical protein